MGDVSNILSTQRAFMEVAYALPLLSLSEFEKNVLFPGLAVAKSHPKNKYL